MSAPIDDQLEIYFGEVTSAQARVYVSLPRGNCPANAKLVGSISGPTCIHTQTLPATYTFRDHSTGDKLIAETVVPDPCFWTAELPYLYKVEIDVRDNDSVIAEKKAQIGLRESSTRSAKLLSSDQFKIQSTPED